MKSFSSDQNEILQHIMELNGIDQFDADVTYGNGSFYAKVKEPKHKFDIQPLSEDVRPADSGSIPVEDASFESVVFDPPFLTYIKNAREHNSIMGKRYGGYWKYDELEMHYRRTIVETARILKPKGIMVFKCQDIIHNHKMHSTHINVVNWADGLFRLKDMFVLVKNTRLAIPPQKGHKPKIQKHARIHHSYFLVLERL